MVHEFKKKMYIDLWFPFSSYSSSPKQNVGQKRLRPSTGNEAKDDNQVNVEEEEVEKKKAKLSQTETGDEKEQSISADSGRASYTAYDNGRCYNKNTKTTNVCFCRWC